jgi:hypothetical protein
MATVKDAATGWRAHKDWCSVQSSSLLGPAHLRPHIASTQPQSQSGVVGEDDAFSSPPE